ncbi:MAG: hypothetical protein ACJATI_002019 [Halioglobus sp.]|jgi:hypothetical protein
MLTKYLTLLKTNRQRKKLSYDNVGMSGRVIIWSKISSGVDDISRA